MKCPHCLVEFHANVKTIALTSDNDGQWYINSYLCANPKCLKAIYFLCNGELQNTPGGRLAPLGPLYSTILVHPKGLNRSPVPPEVTKHIAVDYIEACLVLNDSPKASAALSRRCLQNLLVEKAGVPEKANLSKQIQDVIDSGKLPTHIVDDVDAIRNIGNFAAHPNKNLNTGEILEVEPHEAEWNLDVLESLFDFYYVQPEKARIKREALNNKLNASGKPPMK